ncbi:MAG: hypothetical protein PHE56_13270 [Bacteroidales bacterium]|nr:hypothetical protein [Bacteroidales bacterium]
MKRTLSIIVVVLAAFTAVFTSCGPKDTQGPKIYILGDGDVILPEGKTDTILLLWTKYNDPGVLVEDNATMTSKIVVTNDSADVFTVSPDGYLRSVKEFTLTYTAKDDEMNTSTKGRNIRVANISEAFIGSYKTTRNSMHLDDDTSYNSTISVDSRVAGRLRFPKVYAHAWDGKKTYFKVNADLFSPNLSTTFNERHGYLGAPDDSGRAFFSAMTYTEAIDSILEIEHLRIDAQDYTDSLGNQVYIQGVTDINNVPLSRIEYLGESKTIIRIVLELNVTKNDIVDRVTEIYIPN